jgi:serine/threonine-protein kinase
MATVYVADDLKHRRKVAVKVLDLGLSAATAPERFRREIEIAARLQHPHIVPLFDSGAARGVLYYVMPLVEGESLRIRLERDGQLSVDDVLRLGREVADALDYAHRVGVVHRDIKPANILLSDDHALVADFGIARAICRGAEDPLTQTGTTIGTPAYMSPEQATAPETLDGRSDQYSLACVLFECFAGRPPFRATDPGAMILQHIGADPPLVSEFRSGVPAGAVQAIRRAMAKLPEKRFPKAGDLCGALQARAPRSDSSASADKRLVVLPFENMGTAEDEYFADGITEEITSRLSSLRGLGVIARTSAGQYRKTQKSVREISEELNVSYLLGGSVRWAKQADGTTRIRVTPQLIRASDGLQVWAERYDAVLAEVFQIQSEIAVSVANALDLNLVHAERVALERRPTEHVEAYQSYLRANEYMNRNPLEEDRRIAQGLYERAVELDPRFAIAHAALSKVHASMFWFNYDRTPERMRLAKAAADRALDILPGLPEGHIALGWYHSWGRRDYVRALGEFALAAQSQPNSAELHYALGTVYRRLGRFSETVEEIRTAVDLDPRVPARRFHLGITYTVLRRFEQAQVAFDRIVSAFPDDPVGYIGLAHVALAVRGDLERARKMLLDAGRLVSLGRLFGLLAIHDRQMLRVLSKNFEAAASQSTSEINACLEEWDVYQGVSPPRQSRGGAALLRGGQIHGCEGARRGSGER